MKVLPQRMCIACRSMKEKAQLVRVVKSGDNIFVDVTDKAPGRGAYVCKSAECIKKLVKTKALNRTFKCDVPQNVYIQLEDTVNER